MSLRNLPSLNKLDLQLIEELESDARQTYKDLATKLQVNRNTITSRMQRLLDGGVIKIICWIDPAALGYKFIVAFAIHPEPGQIDEMANKLAACEQVLHIHLCTGRFGIVALAQFRDNDDLSDFLSNELGSISGIVQLETMLALQLVKVSSRLLTDGNEPRHLEAPVRDLDDFDLKLIGELQANARQKAGHIAKKFGVYESTIQRRMKRLMDEHVIEIGTVVHPLVLGYEGIAIIGLKCDPHKVKEVADAIASYKQIQYVSICTGRYDISAWVAFHKLRDLRHFITVELGSIPGLRDTDTMIVYKLVKTRNQLPV